MLTFHGELTPAVYAKALRVHSGPVAAVGGSIAVAALISGFYLFSRGGSVIGATLLFLFGIYLIVKPTWFARKVLSTSELLREPFEGSADATEFVWSTPHFRSSVR